MIKARVFATYIHNLNFTFTTTCHLFIHLLNEMLMIYLQYRTQKCQLEP